MYFNLLPVLETMMVFYQKPLDSTRFQEYLTLLKGNTQNDMELPVMGFNPMAKAHVLSKLEELKALKVEKIMEDALQEVNIFFAKQQDRIDFKVAFNLMDDTKGGWTNRYTTDYDSKFKLSGLVSRRFCTPIFWVSEKLDEQIIKLRVIEACYRSVFWLSQPHPVTLLAHFEQEVFVYAQMKGLDFTNENIDFLQDFYEKEKMTVDYPTIFNFFYGDEATISLGNAPLGIHQAFAGFELAKYTAHNLKKRNIKKSK